MDEPAATPESVGARLPAIKARHRLTLLEIRRSRVGYKVHAELNPKGDTKEKGATRVWKLAPGGFTAHEGRPFTDDEGEVLTNRRGQPIHVHLITRHVTIPRAGVAARVAGPGGHMVATGFLSAAVMERAVTKCLRERATEINERFNAGGMPAPNGTSAVVSTNMPGKIGFGYTVRFRPSLVQAPDPIRAAHGRMVVEVDETELTNVTVVVRVSQSDAGLYMVETAYPTPR